jgi:hypothetical protein
MNLSDRRAPRGRHGASRPPMEAEKSRVTIVGLGGSLAQQSSSFSALSVARAVAHEEQHLYGKGELADHDQVRLEAIKIELDQCWDLLRQREARREFGQDPNEAKVRPPSVVERYKQ